MRRVYLGLLLCGLGFALAGCLNPALTPVKYEGSARVQTDRTAAINLTPGLADGGGTATVVPIGNIFVPMNHDPRPEYFFGIADQMTFSESLRDELNRLGIVKATLLTAGAPATQELVIHVKFISSYHRPGANQYLLQVALTLQAGERKLAAAIPIDSAQGDSLWETWNTTPGEGKLKAGKKLMAIIVPIIEKFIEALPKARPNIAVLMM